jgi:hypothetical protein
VFSALFREAIFSNIKERVFSALFKAEISTILRSKYFRRYLEQEFSEILQSIYSTVIQFIVTKSFLGNYMYPRGILGDFLPKLF